jgi:hypothetical protein
MNAVAQLIDELPSAQTETDQLDFKSAFNPDSKQDWCEIVKDLVAMANSRGGLLVIGVNDDGTPADGDVASSLKLDPAQITDKVASYTGVQFARFEVRRVEYRDRQVVAIIVGRADVPLVFVKPGTYPVVGEKVQQKTAFSAGTVYVRHGAKSETATSDDLRRFIDRRIQIAARRWKKNIRRAVNAPVGSTVQIVPPNMRIVPDGEATGVRLVNDPTAPASKFVNPDQTHPFRQKELVAELRRCLAGKAKPTSHDIQCIRRTHSTDENPNFTYSPKFASRQYSPAFVDWITQEFQKDAEFFAKACQADRERRIKKPR